MPSKKNQTKITILKKNMKNAINSFQKLDFNNTQDINNFLGTITSNFDYIQKILKKEGKQKGGNRSDREIMDQQDDECFICTEGAFATTRSGTNRIMSEYGRLINHEQNENCRVKAHENCWRQLFNRADSYRCHGCGKTLIMQNNRVIPSENNDQNSRIVYNDENDDDDDDYFDNSFDDDNYDYNRFNVQPIEEAPIEPIEPIDNNDWIYASLHSVIACIHTRIFKYTDSGIVNIILVFSYIFFSRIINKHYRRNPNPPISLVTLGYMCIPFYMLSLATLTTEIINNLGGPHLVYDTYDIISLINAKLFQSNITNEEFSELSEIVLNNRTSSGGKKKSRKNKKKRINKTKHLKKK